MNCDLAGYKAQDGLKAQMRAGLLEVTWQGERREQLRAVFTIRDGQPVVQELAVAEGRRRLDRSGRESDSRVSDYQRRPAALGAADRAAAKSWASS